MEFEFCSVKLSQLKFKLKWISFVWIFNLSLTFIKLFAKIGLWYEDLFNFYVLVFIFFHLWAGIWTWSLVDIDINAWSLLFVYLQINSIYIRYSGVSKIQPIQCGFQKPNSQSEAGKFCCAIDEGQQKRGLSKKLKVYTVDFEIKD